MILVIKSQSQELFSRIRAKGNLVKNCLPKSMNQKILQKGKSKKFKINDSSGIWDNFKAFNDSIGSLLVLAKQGDVDKLNLIKPMLYNINEIFDNGVEYPSIDVDTPLLTTKIPNGLESHPDQVKFKTIVRVHG